MATYGTGECHYCHIRLPKPDLTRKTTKRRSGSSGFGFSFNPARKKSVRIQSGRRYYSRKNIWVCRKCLGQHKEPSGIIGGFFSLIFFIPKFIIKCVYYYPLVFLLRAIKFVVQTVGKLALSSGKLAVKNLKNRNKSRKSGKLAVKNLKNRNKSRKENNKQDTSKFIFEESEIMSGDGNTDSD
tara:strand:- start:62 stop:610 length:549 start_codon:yes stop_codon:yes gene_type:complete